MHKSQNGVRFNTLDLKILQFLEYSNKIAFDHQIFTTLLGVRLNFEFSKTRLRNLLRFVNIALMLLFFLLVIMRAISPINRSDSIFFRLTGLPLGLVIPPFLAIIIFFFLIDANFRSSLNFKIHQLMVADSNEQQSQKAIFVFLLSIVPFFIIVFFNMRSSIPHLLQGVDGDYTLAQSINQVRMGHSLTHFNSNLLQGVGGNTYFPINFRIDPASLVMGSVNGQLGVVLGHTVWAFLLYSSTFFLTHQLAFKPSVSLISALFSTYLFVIPGIFNWTAIFSQCPWIYTIIALTNLILARILGHVSAIEKRENTKFGFHKFLLDFGIVCFFVTYAPLWISVFIPIVLILIGVTTFKINKRFRVNFLLQTLAPWILCALIGGGVYIVGFYLSSSTFVFASDFAMPERELKHVSLVFRDFANFIIYLLALVFVFWIKKFGFNSGNIKLSLISLLYFYLGMSFSGSFFYFKRDSYPGPAPIYTEFSVLSLLGVFCGIVTFAFISTCTSHLLPKMRFDLLAHPWLFAMIFGVFTFFYVTTLPAPIKWQFPASNRIIEESRNLSLYESGAAFKGRLASFTGMKINHPIDQPELQSYSYTLLNSLGDDFRHASYWFYGIPTLAEYNPAITAANYRYLTANFSLKNDRSYRNILVLRKANLEKLRLVGVSRMISDIRFENLGEPLQSLSSPLGEVYLYSLGKANLNGFELKDDAAENSLSVDTEKTVLLSRTRSLTIHGHDYVFSSKALGRHRIVLPIEFSNCLNFRSVGKIEVSRFQNFLTAIEFEGPMKVEINYSYGIFHNPTCKVKDFLDYQTRAISR